MSAKQEIIDLLNDNPMRLNDCQIAGLFRVKRNLVSYLRGRQGLASAVGRGRPLGTSIDILAPLDLEQMKRALESRIKSGMTQSAIGREFGVSRQRICQLFDEFKIKDRRPPAKKGA